MNWQHLDIQMQSFSARLTNEVKVTAQMAAKLATTIAADVRFLSPEQKSEIKTASPVPLSDRLAEPSGFSGLDGLRAYHPQESIDHTCAGFIAELRLFCLFARGMLPRFVEGVSKRIGDKEMCAIP